MKKLVVFLAFVFVLVSSQSSFAAYKWRAVTHSSPGTEQLRIFEEFADTVKVLSKGELVIDVFAAGVKCKYLWYIGAIGKNSRLVFGSIRLGGRR